MDTGIYSITCSTNGRCYVGSAASFTKRWREHRRQLEAGSHHSRFLQREWVKRGAEMFEFKKLAVCSKPDLLMYEQAFLDGMRPEYNSAPTAGSQLGYRHTAAAKLKMSASRPKNFSPMTGKSHSEESRAKISQSRKGKCGGKRPPGWIESLSRAQSGRPKSAEHRAKISAALMGHKQSHEQIESRMQKIRGRKKPDFTEDHRINLGKAVAKLSDDEVRSIRAMISDGERQASIAAMYGVHQSVISTIKTKAAYAWVN